MIIHLSISPGKDLTLTLVPTPGTVDIEVAVTIQWTGLTYFWFLATHVVVSLIDSHCMVKGP